MSKRNHVLSIDVGATGIKAGMVDLEIGELLGEKIKVGTPKPATPVAIGQTIKELIGQFDWNEGRIACGFPSVIKNGICHTASNIDQGWIGLNAEDFLQEATGFEFNVINDADAAGIAELTYGHASDVDGTVILLTLGTGIGSAIFNDGKLLTNSELGHLKYKGSIAEKHVSNKARKELELDYETWATELNKYLLHLDHIFSPNLIILGGGVSKRWELYQHKFSKRLPVVNAKLFNDAGIIGAAVYTYPEYLPTDLKTNIEALIS